MAITGVSSSNYNFGSLDSIRKQAQAIQDRVDAESAARKEEQERTGLIRNPSTGEMVELSTVPEWQRERWERREQANSVSPQEMLLAAKATDPNADSVERSKQIAAKATKMQTKLLQGKALSAEEKNWLRANDPTLAAMADRVEQEIEQLENSLRNCKTKEEAQQVYMDAKTRVMSGSKKNDGAILFLMPALDKTYNEYLKQGASGKKVNLWA